MFYFWNIKKYWASYWVTHIFENLGKDRDKVIVLNRFGMQGLAQQLNCLEIEAKVEIHFVYIFCYLWHISSKMLGHQWIGGWDLILIQKLPWLMFDPIQI